MPTTETDIRHSETRRPLLSWQQHHIRVVWAYVGDFPHGLRLGAGPETPWRVWQLTRGRAVVTYRQHTLVVEAGQGAFLPPSPLTLELAPGTVLRSVALAEHTHADRGLLDELVPQVLPGTKALKDALSALVAWVRQQVGRVDSGRPMAFDALDAQAYGEHLALVWTLVGHLRSVAEATTPVPHPVDPRLVRLLAVLQAHATTAFPDKAALAELLGLSWRRIEQLCRLHWDESPQQIHDRLRTREACQRLGQPAVPIKQIAFALGFPSAVRFSQWFSRQTRRSPQAFRQHEHLV